MNVALQALSFKRRMMRLTTRSKMYKDRQRGIFYKIPGEQKSKRVRSVKWGSQLSGKAEEPSFPAHPTSVTIPL